MSVEPSLQLESTDQAPVANTRPRFRCLFCSKPCSDDNGEGGAIPPTPDLVSSQPGINTKEKNIEFPGAENCDTLRLHLRTYFILRKVLEVEASWCEAVLQRTSLLGENGDDLNFKTSKSNRKSRTPPVAPVKINIEESVGIGDGENVTTGGVNSSRLISMESWFKLCDECLKIIETAWNIHEQILVLERNLKKIGEKLKETMRMGIFEDRRNPVYPTGIEVAIKNVVFPDLMEVPEVERISRTPSLLNDLKVEVNPGPVKRNPPRKRGRPSKYSKDLGEKSEPSSSKIKRTKSPPPAPSDSINLDNIIPEIKEESAEDSTEMDVAVSTDSFLNIQLDSQLEPDDEILYSSGDPPEESEYYSSDPDPDPSSDSDFIPDEDEVDPEELPVPNQESSPGVSSEAPVLPKPKRKKKKYPKKKKPPKEKPKKDLDDPDLPGFSTMYTNSYGELRAKSFSWKRCPHCKTNIKREEDLEKHLELHTEREETGLNTHLNCTICTYPAVDDIDLEMHLNHRHKIGTEKKRKWLCPEDECKFKTKTWGILKHHVEKNHPAFASEAYTMDLNSPSICPEKKSALLDYLLQCPLCNPPLRFPHTRKYFQHKRNTHPELQESFECTECGTKFSCNGKLQAHVMKVHQGRSRFVCETCGAGYQFISHLKRHVKDKHSGNKSKHICHLCGLDYFGESDLKKHQKKVHPELLPYAIVSTWTPPANTPGELFRCKHCDLTSPYRVVIHRHAKTHKEQMGHKCPKCGNCYTNAQGLKRHLRINHPEKKEDVPCPYCKKLYLSLEYMKDHLNKYCKMKKKAEEEGTGAASTATVLNEKIGSEGEMK